MHFTQYTTWMLQSLFLDVKDPYRCRSDFNAELMTLREFRRLADNRDSKILRQSRKLRPILDLQGKFLAIWDSCVFLRKLSFSSHSDLKFTSHFIQGHRECSTCKWNMSPHITLTHCPIYIEELSILGWLIISQPIAYVPDSDWTDYRALPSLSSVFNILSSSTLSLCIFSCLRLPMKTDFWKESLKGSEARNGKASWEPMPATSDELWSGCRSVLEARFFSLPYQTKCWWRILTYALGEMFSKSPYCLSEARPCREACRALICPFHLAVCRYWKF